METQDRARIGAYLLGRMAARERAEFEAHLLEEPALLAAVHRTEAAILAGDVPAPAVARRCAVSFVLGIGVGALLAGFVLYLSS